MTVSVFVVADAHGNANQVLGLLKQEGLILSDDTRVRRQVLVMQLGDLANCVGSSEQDDIEALALVGPVIDLMLVGNHEHPHFGGPAFSGFWPHLDVKRRLLELNDHGLIQPSLAVGDILVSHAGLSSYWGRPDETAEKADEWLRSMWASAKRDPIFSAIGPSRGGMHHQGGVLWSDWSEPKRSSFGQLVGHTVGDTIRRKGRTTCIDLGGGKGSRIAGAWIREGRIDVVIYDAAEGEAA